MGDALTILAVDDSAAIRTVLGVILDAGGHRAMLAESVDEGLDLVKLGWPDVVLTDYRMPDKTGHDLVLRLRAEGFRNPIFVISSETDPLIRTSMFRVGADRWLPKPVCAATLLAALDDVARNAAKGQFSDRLRVPTCVAGFG